MKENVGIIDLGSNTFHLLIASIDTIDNSYDIIHKLQIPVKLSDGAFLHNLILEEAIVRANEAFIKFAETIQFYKVKRINACGTSVLREATNANRVIESFKSHLGFYPEIIDGFREAELIYKGVLLSGSLESPFNSLIMDIGGGSVEFIIANEKELLFKNSYLIGASFLKTKFSEFNPNNLLEINSFLEDTLSDLVLACKTYNVHRLVGAAGSFETYHLLINQVNNTQNEDKNGLNYPLEITELKQVISLILGAQQLDINENPNIAEFRKHLIQVTSALVKFIIDRISIQEFNVSTYSLKEGALYELIYP